MSFLGKEYKFESEENFEDFVKSLELTPEETEAFLNYRPSQKFELDGDTYTYTMTSDDTTKEIKFQSGVAFEDTVNNRPCKVAFTVDGDAVYQVQNFGEDALFSFTREFKDDEMTVTINSTKWDGVARRIYKA